MDQTNTEEVEESKFLTKLCLVITTPFLLVLPIAYIAVGATYLQECPLQHYIPVYVLVWGVFSATLVFLSCARVMEGGQTKLSCIYNLLIGLVIAFLLCWMICGSSWIYSVYPPNYDQTVAGEPYCNRTLYRFAFWTTTLGYILFGLALLFGCCVCFCFCLSMIGQFVR